MLALVLLMQACSTLTLGYNRAATLSYWWLDSQLDLTETQSLQVRNDLEDIHRWHRREALPRYAELLNHWERLAAQDFTAAQACEQADVVRSQLLQVAQRSTRALVVLGQSVRPVQVEHLRRQQAKDNSRFRDDFVTAAQSGLAERSKRMIRRLEMFYGTLEPAQRQLVQTHLQRGSFDGALALAERERRQADVLQAIAALQANPAQGHAIVEAVIQRAIASPSPRYRAASRQWQREGCELVAAVHNSSTPAQRKLAAEALRSYTGDFTLLAQQD